MKHSVNESWEFIGIRHDDGTTELTGVRYVNGDQEFLKDMAWERWLTFLRKAGLDSKKKPFRRPS